MATPPMRLSGSWDSGVASAEPIVADLIVEKVVEQPKIGANGERYEGEAGPGDVPSAMPARR